MADVKNIFGFIPEVRKPEEKKLELIKIGHIIWFWQLQKEEES